MSNQKPTGYLDFLQATNNFLLIKDEIGKPKPTTRALPDSSFMYGKKIEMDKEGAGSLITSWQSHRSSSVAKADKDFKRLNALSVSEKVCTSSEQYKFRQNADVRMKSAQSKSRAGVPDMTFGSENRPSTPMKAVLSNFYGEFAGDHLNRSYTPLSTKPNIPKGRSTKGFDKRNEAIKASLTNHSKTLFKLKKFSNVQSKTETRRK
jgi:hypothetical protein